MPNPLHIRVENPDELLNAGLYDAGALIQLQSSTTETQDGTFADLTGTGSTATIAIVAATTAYTGYDPGGGSATWYRSRYKNAAGTRTSDWSASFQVADEAAGQLCSLYDVKQQLELTNTSADEQLGEFIEQVSTAIMGYTGRRFARTPSAGVTTFLFDGCSGRTLRVPAGIATATVLEVAIQSQPESGGTYTTVTAADWFLRPVLAERDYGWPATQVVISDIAGSYFSPGYNTVRLTGALGWAQVPGDIAGIATRATVAAWMSKGSGAGGVAAVGPSGAMMILRYISPADRETLDWYRHIP